VTLAQVFWLKDQQGQPARFYAVCDRELMIARDFAEFGTEITQLRKRLRASGVEIEDSFPPYGALFRRRFGISSDQALELFHQTVSMKSVGNLTDFVRGHMLEPFDVLPRIQALIAHFDDLNRAHEAVVKAKRQVALLTPLVEDCDRHARPRARDHQGAYRPHQRVADANRSRKQIIEDAAAGGCYMTRAVFIMQHILGFHDLTCIELNLIMARSKAFSVSAKTNRNFSSG
jgi:uncharacterized protein YPO0396